MAALSAQTWRNLIRRAIYLHPHGEAFGDGQVEFLRNASTEASPARPDAPGGAVTGPSLGNGRCTTLRLILLGVENDDFAATKKTRIQRKCTRTKQHKRNTDDRKV